MITPKVSKSLIVISSSSDIFDDDQVKKSNDYTNPLNDGDQLVENCSHTHVVHSSTLIPPQEVFIGNLKPDIPDRTLVRKLQELFTREINLVVPDFRFTIFHRDSKKHPRKYGFIVLANAEDEERAFSLDDTSDLDFVIGGLKLNVRRRLSVRNKVTKWNKLTFNGRKCLVNRSRSDTFLQPLRKTTTLTINSKISETTHKRELQYGQHLPTEDRVTEYKRGSGNYMKSMLISHVRKYVCAFLNSEGRYNYNYIVHYYFYSDGHRTS